MKVTVLGCGASAGVPLITGNWGSCNPDNPKNRRRRASLFIEDQDITLLVDVSPDVREQLLLAKPTHLSSILLTHCHFDHIGGLDELRPIVVFLNNREPLNVYLDDKTLKELQQRCPYLLNSIATKNPLYPPLYQPIDHGFQSFEVGHLEVLPFLQDHGMSQSVGYRIGNFAYSTDVIRLPDASKAMLQDLDVWVVDCLSRDARPTHANLETALGWIAELNPKRAYLTHMDFSLDYEDLLKDLPPNVFVCWDGLEIEV